MIDWSTDIGKRALERVKDELCIWLTTTDKDGMPQPRPVWFIWDNDAFLIYSMPAAQKLKHIARNPNVALNFDGGRTGEDIIVFLGTAVVDTKAPPVHKVQAYVTKYAKELPEIGLTAESMAASYSTALRVTPTKLRGMT